MAEPILLTVRDVCVLLSLSESKVRNLIAQRRLPVVHIDHAVRIHRTDALIFAESLRESVNHLRVVG